jgi:hypothetical protein
MATNEKELVTENAPVATPVTTPLPPISPTNLYSPTNIKQISIPGNKRAMDMKLSDLSNKLSKANSIADLNQIEIMNQPKAMGVLTGEAAYRSKLDTARINAFNSLYNNRLLEEQRKQAERDTFISQYGADPSQRPKGMSKREFSAALGAGQFSNLLTTDYKLKQAQLAKSLAPEKASAGAVSSTNRASASQALQAAKGADNYTNPQAYIEARDLYVKNTPGATYDDFDSQFAGMLNPRDYGVVGFTPAQQSALSGITPAVAAKTKEEEQQNQAQVAVLKDKVATINELEKSPGLNNAVGPSAFKWVTRMGTPFSGEKQNFIAGVQNLVSQDTISALINLKAQGGTLGALSDQERIMLQTAATRIGAWAVYKDGQVVGYNVSEKAFKEELTRLKALAQKAIDKSKGGTGAQQGEIVEKNGKKYQKVEGGWIEI